MKTREQIEEKYKWDLSSYFKNQQEYDNDFKLLESKKDELCKYEGRLNSEDVIFECLLKSSNQSLILGKLYVYSALRVKEDQANGQNQERLMLVSNLATEISANNSFIDVELSELDNAFLQQLATNKSYPQFNNYFKDIIREKQYVLSKKEEKLLSLMSDFTDGFSENFDKFDDADLVFDNVLDSAGNTHQLNHSNFVLLLQNADRTLRKNTIQSMNGQYGKFNNFLASNYIANVKKNVFATKIRGFKSCLEASLFFEEVDKKVYETLIQSVHSNLDKLHSYLELKRKTLNLDKIAIYDTFAPVTNFDTNYTYEKAVQTVIDATKVLGEEYTSLIMRAKNERWIDVMPNQNKDSGAYSWGAYGALPVVSLNFVGDSNSVFTLAHELGHCMHSYFSNKTQPQENAGYTIFVAEVASTVNEMLLCEHLLKLSKTKQEKIYYLDHILNTARSTIFRQTQFSEFEKTIHDMAFEGQPLSKDVLNNTYKNLNDIYYGQKVEQVPEMQYEWSRIPHFYNSFYVYKYATGLISAMAITKRILSGEKNAVNDYLKFLSLGSSLDPVSLLKVAGIDLTNKQTFDNAFEYMQSIIEKWEQLV